MNLKSIEAHRDAFAAPFSNSVFARLVERTIGEC